MAVSAATLVALGGCGGSEPEGPEYAPDPVVGLAAGELGTLIETDWSLRPGTEQYLCVRRTVGEDVLVDAFEPIDARGTHHTVLTVGDPTDSDGTRPCHSPFEMHRQVLYATGIGTGALELPSGLATRLEAGQQLLLNLHLYNTGAEPLGGRSGTRARAVAPADVEHETEAVLMGEERFGIEPRSTATIEGRCSQVGDVTLFALFPHMHQIGTHMTVVADSTLEGSVTLHDAPFRFDRQVAEIFPQIRMELGDVVRVTCEYENPFDREVRWGESSNDEMCYAIVYRYPALGLGEITCTE